jgi:hypothetical protein
MGLVAKRLCSAHPGPVVRVVCVADGCGYDLPRGELRVRLPWLGGVLASRANRLGVGEGVSAVDPVELPECADNSSALLMLVEHMWGGGGRLVAAGDVEMARYALHSGSFFDFPALVERGERRIREIGVTAETAAALLADGDCFGLGGLREVAFRWYLGHPDHLDADTGEGKVDASIAAEIHALRKVGAAPPSHWPATPTKHPWTSYPEMLSACAESLDEQERRLQKTRARREELGIEDEDAGGAALQEAELDVKQRRHWVAGHRQIFGDIQRGHYTLEVRGRRGGRQGSGGRGEAGEASLPPKKLVLRSQVSGEISRVASAAICHRYREKQRGREAAGRGDCL